MSKKYSVLLWVSFVTLLAGPTLAQTLPSTGEDYRADNISLKSNGDRNKDLSPVNSILEVGSGNCPAFVLPKLQYTYHGALRHSIGLGINFVDAPRKCDCSSTFGGLCYLLGPTYGFDLNYFPFSKTADVSVNYGFRYLFAYAGGKAGYAHSGVKDGVPRDFVYLEPNLGLDILIARITVGYSIRTAEISDRKGSFVLTITASPWEVGKKGQFKSSIASMIKSSKEQRRNFR